jgi:transposase
MNSAISPDSRREQAIALRRAGKSRREIKEILGVTSNATLGKLLAGEPPPEWTRRPRAKDDLHAKARQLREQGYDYDRIAAELGVSKGSVSLWVRDLPRPERLSYEECRKRAAEGVRRYWEAERPAREAQREATRAAAAAEIGALTQYELVIAGAIAYWCEGTKSKPHHQQDRVIFINSDPGLIAFFLRFLDAAGVDRAQVRYRVYIHETADVGAAERYWLEVTGADPAQFHNPTLKRHNPKDRPLEYRG